MLNRSAELTSALSPGLMIGQKIFHEFVEGMGESVGAVTALGHVKGGNFCREVWGRQCQEAGKKLSCLF